MTSRTIAYRLILLSSLIWCLLILSAPVMKHLEVPIVAGPTYAFFSRICHQIDSHSLHLFGEKLGVCARCSAIYFAFLLSVSFYPLFVRKNLPSRIRTYTRREASLLVVSAIPLLIDVGLDLTGIQNSTLPSRLITGGLLGFALPLVLLPAAEEAFGELRHRISLSSRR